MTSYMSKRWKKKKSGKNLFLTIRILGTSNFHRVCGKSFLEWIVKHRKQGGSCESRLKRSLTPEWSLTPRLLRSYVWLYPRIIVSKSHENTSKYVDTVTLFANTWTKGPWTLDDLWPHICCRGAGKARFNVATPTNATVTCTAYVLPYNLQTKSI